MAHHLRVSAVQQAAVARRRSAELVQIARFVGETNLQIAPAATLMRNVFVLAVAAADHVKSQHAKRIAAQRSVVVQNAAADCRSLVADAAAATCRHDQQRWIVVAAAAVARTTADRSVGRAQQTGTTRLRWTRHDHCTVAAASVVLVGACAIAARAAARCEIVLDFLMICIVFD